MYPSTIDHDMKLISRLPLRSTSSQNRCSISAPMIFFACATMKYQVNSPHRRSILRLRFPYVLIAEPLAAVSLEPTAASLSPGFGVMIETSAPESTRNMSPVARSSTCRRGVEDVGVVKAALLAEAVCSPTVEMAEMLLAVLV